jgi:hypothetical protein
VIILLSEGKRVPIWALIVIDTKEEMNIREIKAELVFDFIILDIDAKFDF